MARSGKQKFRLIKIFFVIKGKDLEKYLFYTRKNILSLVHYGFSREELYYMPLTEFMDYIKILNDERIEMNDDLENGKYDSDNDNIKMAGNTLKNFF